jgi:hypothetical protein
VKIRLSNEIYEALLKLATERGVSIDEYAGWVVVDHVMRPGTDAKAELSRLEKWVKEIDGRLSLVEKYMEDVLSAKTPTSTPRAQAPQAPQQPQFQPPQQPPAPQPPEPAPKLMPASELPEARKALEEVERAKAEEAKPEEAVGIGKRSREGVFKELTVKWILEKAKKDPDQFVEEWVRKGYNANRVGDRVVIASDDVIESVVNELNARGVQGPGALQGIEDKDLKRKATAISAAGFIYFDAVTKTWKRT